MHHEIFHFEILKNFMEILEIISRPLFEIFHEIFKLLKT